MLPTQLVEAELTGRIIGAFYAVYDELGYGFLEKVYCAALAIELTKRDLLHKREARIKVYYHRDTIGIYRADFVVENRIVLEVKATKLLVEEDRCQLMNCLRASDLEVGLLLHFGPKARFERRVSENSRKARHMPEAVGG